jgi:hypothetical protein
MKITICGSQTNSFKIHEIKNKLEKAGHVIYSHELMEQYAKGNKKVIAETKNNHAKMKINNNTFKWYYEKIKQSDAILVCNFEKNNTPGYIGGSVLMEIGYAYVLDKKIYFLFPLPEVNYKDELIAAQPIILNGDIAKIDNHN